MITIKKRALPDINKMADLPADLIHYGRFAILNDGTFWFGGVSSSHPQNTYVGFYFAVSIDKKFVFISPCKANADFVKNLSSNILLYLLKILKIKDPDVSVELY
jgi:hypothetical protein